MSTHIINYFIKGYVQRSMGILRVRRKFNQITIQGVDGGFAF